MNNTEKQTDVPEDAGRKEFVLKKPHRDKGKDLPAGKEVSLTKRQEFKLRKLEII